MRPAGRAQPRSTRLFAGIALGTGLLVLLTQTPALAGPRGTLKGLAAPITTVVTHAVDRVDAGLGLLQDAGRRRADNHKLQAENRALKRQLAELQAAGRENADLRQALGFERSFGHRLLAASVIARSPDGWTRSVTIDRGRAEGIEPSMVVVSGAGLVGRVTDVGQHSATVQTLVDASSRVNVYTALSGLDATAIGEGGLISMAVLPKPGVVAEPGEWALTSGSGGTHPRGIVVGQVAVFHRRDSATLETAELAPANDFGSLSTVLVIRDWMPAR